MTPPQLALAWLVALNVATAAAYACDQLAAPRGAHRVREGTPRILCASPGAWAGAWVVFFGMRHKTRYCSSWIVQAAATVLWVGLLPRLLVR